MAQRRRDRGGPAAELEAVLDELEVRFLLDPDTNFDTSADPTTSTGADTEPTAPQ